ncbi:MAG: hypothetical protein MUP97_04415 [Acidimicrobiia bacterium]|nr:hypothetical protein [Acidimicrobiia bacterium]
MRRSLVLVVTVLAAVVASLAPAVAGAAPASQAKGATVTGPVTGGTGEPTLIATGFDLADAGYVAEEYFIEGTATAYDAAKPLKSDGKWAVKPVSTAPYKTRIVVYRPEKAKDFSGTVVVEWLNVSAGFDSAAHWMHVHNAFVRSGAAWVGVSAQAVGVQGGAEAVGGVAAGGVKAADPERYGSLTHPGDIYSYDIFSQVGRALRAGGKTGPLAGFPVERVIGAGQSQGAIYLTTYVNAIQPRDKVFDGFLLHSRFAGAANLTKAPPAPAGTPFRSLMPSPSRIRTDTGVPVLTFETEFEVASAASGAFVDARQPDTKMLRLWEVAGTSHFDTYGAPGFGYHDLGDGQAERDLLDPAKLSGGPLNCAPAINSGGAYLVLNAAFSQLERWIRDGTPPPKAPRLDVTAAPKGASSEPASAAEEAPTVHRDEHGIALGGIRTPLVEAPIATLSSEGATGGTFCRVFGTTVPFDAATLSSLYPTHADYVAKFNQATDRAV